MPVDGQMFSLVDLLNLIGDEHDRIRRKDSVARACLCVAAHVIIQQAVTILRLSGADMADPSQADAVAAKVLLVLPADEDVQQAVNTVMARIGASTAAAVPADKVH